MAEYIKREILMRKIHATPEVDGNKRAAQLLECILSAPAADVAPVVHGRWISWEQAGNFIPSPDRHECSVCHDAAQVLANGIELLSPYCQNCGARMDLEEQNGKS